MAKVVFNPFTGDLLLVPDSGGTGAVTSVNGQAGIVQLNADDIPYDNTASGLTATDVQAAIDEVVAEDGDVNGPASSVDNAIARFDGTSGKLLQNSPVTIADNGLVTITPVGTSSYTPLFTFNNNNTTTPMIVWTSDSAGNNRGLQFAPDGGIAAGILNDGSIFANTFSPAGPGEQKLAINFLTLQTRALVAGTPSSGYQTLYFKTDKNLYMVDNTGLETQVNGGGSTVFSDSAFRIQDNGDATKQLAFEVSGIATGTTRTITVPNANVTIPSTIANGALSNLTNPTSINQDLIPNSNLGFLLGSSTLQWNTLYTLAVLNAGNTLTLGTDGASAGATIILTGNRATGNTGLISLTSGNAASGNSGGITLQIGTASGTRGKIKLVDGSEGTTGHVWTSTDTAGNGHWAAASGGGANTALSNLAAVAINTSLLPATSGSADLGSGTKPWGTVYTSVLNDGNNTLAMIVDNRTLHDSTGTLAIDFDLRKAQNGANTLLQWSGVNVVIKGTTVDFTQSTNVDFTGVNVIGLTAGGANNALSNLASVAINTDLIFAHDTGDSTRIVKTADSSSSTATDNIIYQSGDFSGTGNLSGNVTIKSGTSSEGTGSVLITSGTPGSGFPSGAIQIFTTPTNATSSGNIAVATGTVTGAGQSGDMAISTGDADTSNSGGLTLRTGSNVDADSGQILLSTGNVTSTGQSGPVIIHSGTAVSATSGLLLVQSGNGSAGGASGTATFGSGNGTGSGSISGEVIINTGTSVDGTGQLSIFTGNSSGSSSGGISISTGTIGGSNQTSGSININTGDPSGSDSSTGDINLTTGTPTGTGVQGSVVVIAKYLVLNNANIAHQQNLVPTITDDGNAGTGSSVGNSGTDMGGTLTLSTGTGAGSGNQFTVTYQRQYPSTSIPVFSPSNANAAGANNNVYLSNFDANGFTIAVVSPLNDSTTYTWTFHVLGTN